MLSRDTALAHKQAEQFKGKRILVISALFPPDVIGGAEISANNLTQWLVRNGAEVGVLTTAKTREEVCEGKVENGLKIWRVWMPRLYPQYYFAKAQSWQKPIWHLQDHFDPRNRKIVAQVLEAFNPAAVHIHVLQGIGYNALTEIGNRRIPVVYFLHDLALACIRMAMFKKGRVCAQQCTLCKASAFYKARLFAQVPRLGFCSPSRANLENLSRYFPVDSKPNTVLLNANKYPAATEARKESQHLRILFVGRLHSAKGVHLLLEAAAKLAKNSALTLTIVGAGPDEAALREKYGSLPGFHFTGFVSEAEISNMMVNSDVLCIPSIWLENSPGVVIHALGLGVPVIGSNKGGIPELIEDGKNGLLFKVNDTEALQTTLERIIQEHSLLKGWREYALSNAYKFDQDYLAAEIVKFMDGI
jgi:glycosyltransferase involved in cell wall biosynthesis